MTIKLVVFDVDGTLFQTCSWQYIHENLGTWSQAQENKMQFFAGRITYEDWAQLDASLWRNQPVSRISQIVSQMRYMRGAEETLATLNRRGLLVYLLSAGLSLVGERVQRETHVDGYLANSLGVRDGFLTGDVQVNVSFYQKGKILNSILRKFNLTQMILRWFLSSRRSLLESLSTLQVRKWKNKRTSSLRTMTCEMCFLIFLSIPRLNFSAWSNSGEV